VHGSGKESSIDCIQASAERRPSAVDWIPTGDVLSAHGARSSKVTADIDLAVWTDRNRVDLADNSGAERGPGFRSEVPARDVVGGDLPRAREAAARVKVTIGNRQRTDPGKRKT